MWLRVIMPSVSCITVFSLLCAVNVVTCVGTFELQLLAVQNYRGELLDGRCCGGGEEQATGGSGGERRRCRQPCNTYVRLCLKEYQSVVTSGGSCSFGSTTSAVIGHNSFTFPIDLDIGIVIKLPFEFRWTVSIFFFTTPLSKSHMKHTMNTWKQISKRIKKQID